MKKIIPFFILCLVSLVSAQSSFIITSPYEGVQWDNWYQYKGSSHVHTTYSTSDGNSTRKQILEDYYHKDFNVVTITDHDVSTDSWTQTGYKPDGTNANMKNNTVPTTANGGLLTPEEELAFKNNSYFPNQSTRNGYTFTRTSPYGMIGLRWSNEVTAANDGVGSAQPHFGVYFGSDGPKGGTFTYGSSGGLTPVNLFKKVDDLGGITIVNHPGRQTAAWDKKESASSTAANINHYAAYFRNNATAVGMEVINKLDGESKADRILWDNLLKVIIPEGKRNVWGFSGDDTHQIDESGYSFNMMLLPELTQDNIIESKRNGTFYAVARVSYREGANINEQAGVGYSRGSSSTLYLLEQSVPKITNIAVDPTNGTITITGEYYDRIEWIAGGSLSTAGGVEIFESEYSSAGSTLNVGNYSNQIIITDGIGYVRAQLVSTTGIAFTQAFIIEEIIGDPVSFDGYSEDDFDFANFFYYNGTPIVPEQILFDQKTLVLGKDYEITSIENNVGVGTATVTIAGIKKYSGSVTLTFDIDKPEASYSSLPANLTATTGALLSSIELPPGWSWVNGNQVLSSVGQQSFVAEYNPDPSNYSTVTANLTVAVEPAGQKTVQISNFGDSYYYHARTNSALFTDAFDMSAITSWKQGATPAGFGTSIPATLVTTLSGSDRYQNGSSGNQHAVTYFKKSFNLDADFTPEDLYDFSGQHKIDDALIIYVNGTEIYRFNVGASPTVGESVTSWSGHANAGNTIGTAATVDFSINSNYSNTTVGSNKHAASLTNLKNALQPGANTITCAVLQQGATSSDLFFDLKLSATVIKSAAAEPTSIANAVLKSDTYIYTGSAIKPVIMLDDVELVENTHYIAEHINNTNVGTATVIITGKESNNYLDGATLYFEILRADPSYTEPTGLTASYGTVLENVTLPAGWAWVNPTDLVGEVGTQTHEIKFIPDDTQNYNIVTITMSVTVKPAGLGIANVSTFGDSYYYYGRTNSEFFAEAFDMSMTSNWTFASAPIYHGSSPIGNGEMLDGTKDDLPTTGGTLLENGTNSSQAGSSSSRHTWRYFKKNFTLDEDFSVENLGDVYGNHRVDDALIIYINGAEVYRYNVGPAPASGTSASSATTVEIGATVKWDAYVGYNSDATTRPFSINGDYNSRQTGFKSTATNNPILLDAASRTNLENALQPGVNVITYVIGQNSASSSDLWFDLELNIEYAKKPPVPKTSIAGAELEAGIYVYTGEEYEPAVKLGEVVLTKGTDYEAVYTDNVNAGTAMVAIIGIGEYEGSEELTFVINQKPITVTAVTATKVYGTEDPVFEYASEGLVGEDELTGVLERGEGENVGTYTITQGTLDAGDNYEITFNGGELEITKKHITVTATGNSKVYGDADPEFGYTSDALVGEDVLTGSLERENGDDVGTYAISQGSLTAGGNYEISFIGADFEIIKATVTAPTAPEGLTATYGQALADVSLEEYAGWLWADTEALVGSVGEQNHYAIYNPDPANYNNSAPVALTLTVAKAAGPEAPTVAATHTTNGQSNGKITGVTDAMEYKSQSVAPYTQITGTEITGLAAGTYLVRFVETDMYEAGADAKVTINGSQATPNNNTTPPPYIPPVSPPSSSSVASSSSSKETPPSSSSIASSSSSEETPPSSSSIASSSSSEETPPSSSSKAVEITDILQTENKDWVSATAGNSTIDVREDENIISIDASISKGGAVATNIDVLNANKINSISITYSADSDWILCLASNSSLVQGYCVKLPLTGGASAPGLSFALTKAAPDSRTVNFDVSDFKNVTGASISKQLLEHITGISFAPITDGMEMEASLTIFGLEVNIESDDIISPALAIARPALNFVAKAINGGIMLNNLPTSAKIELYSMNGKCMYVGNSGNSQTLNIPVQAKGMYVIRINAAGINASKVIAVK